MDQFGNSVKDIKLIYFRLSNAISLLSELKDCTKLSDDPFITSAMTDVTQILHRAEERQISKEVEYKTLAPVIQELNEYIQVMAITKLFQELRRVNYFLIGISKWFRNGPERARQYSDFTRTSDSGSDNDTHWQRLAELRQEMLGESSLSPQRKPLPTHSQRADEIVTLLQGKNKRCDSEPGVQPQEKVEVEKTAQRICKPTSFVKPVSCSASDLVLPQSCASADNLYPEKTEEPLQFDERTDKMLQSIDKKLRDIEIRQWRRMETKNNRINHKQIKRKERRRYREQNDEDYKHAYGQDFVCSAQAISRSDRIMPCGKSPAERPCREPGQQDKSFEKRTVSGSSKLSEIHQNQKLYAPAVEQQPLSKTSHRVTWATPLHRLVWPNPP